VKARKMQHRHLRAILFFAHRSNELLDIVALWKNTTADILYSASLGVIYICSLKSFLFFPLILGVMQPES